MMTIQHNEKNTFEVALIKEDLMFFGDLLRYLPEMSTLIFGLFPYVSLFATESHSYLKDKSPYFSRLVRMEHEHTIRSSRIMIKLFDEQRDITEITNSVEWMLVFHADLFINNHKGCLSWLKKLLQTDLGLYFYDEKVISTTHVASFNLGLDRTILDKFGLDTKTAVPTLSKSIGENVARYIKSLYALFGIDVENMENKFVKDGIGSDKCSYVDVKASKYYPSIFNEVSSVSLNFSLLLFLSSINFVHVALRKNIRDTPTTLFKLKYIVVYHLHASLKRMQNYFYPSQSLTEKSKDYFKEILSNKELRRLTSKADFRNFLVHYTIKNMDYRKLSLEKELYGLIEHYFDGMSFKELNDIVDKQLERIANILEQWHYPNGRPTFSLTPL